MYFAFETCQADQLTNPPEELLTSILLLSIENQRLQQMVNEGRISNDSYQQKANLLQQHKTEMQIKQLTITNLNNSVKDIHKNYQQQQRICQQLTNKLNLLQFSYRQEIQDSKSQLTYFKNKYEQELQIKQKNSKIQQQYKQLKQEIQIKNKEIKQLMGLVNTTKSEIMVLQLSKQEHAIQAEQKIQDLKSSNHNLTNSLESLKEINKKLQERPSEDELQKCIQQIKQKQQQIHQLSLKLNSISQELTASKQKNRKLQYEFSQLSNYKRQLERIISNHHQSEETLATYLHQLSLSEQLNQQLQESLASQQSLFSANEMQYQLKIKQIQDQKNNAVEQWHTILQQMNKQKDIIQKLQSEIDQHYYPKNIYKNYMIGQQNSKSQQAGLFNDQKIPKRDDLNNQLKTFDTYDDKNSSKALNKYYKYNRSNSLNNKQLNSSLQQSSRQPKMQSFLSFQLSQRQDNQHIPRTTSEPKFIYHSNNQCQDCSKKNAKEILDVNNNFYGRQYHDQKKKIMEKLNQIKPNDFTLPSQRQKDSILSKNLRGYHLQGSNSQAMLKLNYMNRAPKIGTSSSSRLNLKGKSSFLKQKQNLNEAIYQKYEKMLHKH